MHLKLRYRKENLSRTNTETGDIVQLDEYFVIGEIEYYNFGWGMTGIDPKTGKNRPQQIGRFQMFPNQWEEFRDILKGGAEETGSEILFIYDDKEWEA